MNEEGTVKKEDSKEINITEPVVRTIINFTIILFDTIPAIAFISLPVELINIVTVVLDKLKVKVPSLTPDIRNNVLGAGIVGWILDSVTLELLPIPSSLIIHGAQILHDIRPIHEYVEQNPKVAIFKPVTGTLNKLSYKLIKKEQSQN